MRKQKSPLESQRASEGRLGRDVLLEVFQDRADRGQLLGVLVRDLDVELFLDVHDQLGHTQRVGAQILDEFGLGLDLQVVTQFELDDLVKSLLDGSGVFFGHTFLPWIVGTGETDLRYYNICFLSNKIKKPAPAERGRAKDNKLFFSKHFS